MCFSACSPFPSWAIPTSSISWWLWNPHLQPELHEDSPVPLTQLASNTTLHCTGPSLFPNLVFLCVLWSEEWQYSTLSCPSQTLKLTFIHFFFHHLSHLCKYCALWILHAGHFSNSSISLHPHFYHSLQANIILHPQKCSGLTDLLPAAIVCLQLVVRFKQFWPSCTSFKTLPSVTSHCY